MDCRVAQELISSYIDDMLDREEARQLEAHIGSCSECRQRFEQMKDVVQMVGTLEEEELPDGFSDRLRSRLEAEQVSKMVYKKHSGFSKWVKWVGIAAAVAVIVLVIRVLSVDGLLYISPQGKGQTDSAALEDVSKSSLKGSQAEESAGASDRPAAQSEVQQEQIRDNGDVRVFDTESKTSEQAEDADGYIKVDKVELRVQDVCITPQTLMIRAIQHGIEVVEQTENSITLRVKSIEQRKALYRELELLGEVEEVGTNFESDMVSIVIVQQE